MQSLIADWSKWPAHILFFAAAGLLCLATCILAILAFQSGNFETGVFRIFSYSQQSAGSGSGFKVSDPGYVVTNFHVVDGGQRIKVAYLEDGEPVAVSASLIWYSRDKDLAILKTRKPIPGPSVTLADINRDKPEKMQSVFAVGFPGIADRLARAINDGNHDALDAMRTDLDPTISQGAVQRLVSSPQRLTIQHSSNINPGNSGGPLFDSCQRVVGVNTLAAVSTFSIDDLTTAIIRNRRVQVTNPGEMEFAVHSREVIAGLDERNIPYSTLGGSCLSGLDQAETTKLIAGLVLAILCAAAGTVLFFKQSPVPAAAHPAGLHKGHEVQNQFHVIAEVSSSGDQQNDMGATHALATSHALVDQVSGQRFDLQILMAAKGRVTIGRAPELTDVAIDDGSISRHHAQISQDGDTIWVEDNASTNGTFINGKKIAQGAAQRVPDGAMITFGTRQMRVEQSSSIPKTSDGADDWLLSGFDPSGQIIQHEVSSLTLNGARSSFTRVCSVGRDASNDLVLKDDAVSRHHAELGFDEAGNLFIRDLGSANGTFADKQAVSSRPVPLDQIRTVQIGTTELTLTKR